MKKFWNLMLAALVIIGAAACTENYEGVDVAESLSFYAEIGNDDTRAYIEKDGEQWKTTFEGTETLYVNDEYAFTNTTEEPGKFTCTAVGVSKLAGQKVTITTDGNHNSLQGKAAFNATATVENFGAETVKLEAHTSFFRYTFNGEGNVVLTTEANAFIGADGKPTNTVTISGFGEHFVAFWPGVELTTPFTLTINGETVREKELTLKAGTVYNLGTYEGTKNESFGIVGAHQGWNTENLDAMYLIPGSNTYVSRNVKLAAGGFKIYGTTKKTVTIEHPEVEGGESGYLFLKPNNNWHVDNARFAAYFFGNGEEWISMTDSNKDGIYAVQQPKKTYPKVIFCRMNPGNTTNGWNNKWNQTGDLTIPTNGDNLFTVPSGSWDGATTSWSTHTVVEHQDAWTEVTEEVTAWWMGMSDKSANTDITNWVTGYSNNGGADIKVGNINKTYDIYFSREADQDWGFVYYFTVRESGSAQPALK